MVVGMDFKSICRLCAEKSTSLYPVFEDSCTLIKLESCSPIQISEDDGLPGVICDPCMHKLNAAYSFRFQIAVAHQKLKNLLEKSSDNLSTTSLEDSNVVPKEECLEVEDRKNLNEDANIVSTEFIKIENEKAINVADDDFHDSTNVDNFDNDSNLSTVYLEESIVDASKIESFDDDKLIEYLEEEFDNIPAGDFNVESLRSIESLKTEPTENGISESSDDEFERYTRKIKKRTPYVRKRAYRNRIEICPVCGKALKYNSFADHMSNVHEKKLKAACEICGKLLFTKRGLWHHKKSHETNVVKCPYCSNVYKNRPGYLRHYREVHLGIKRHKCKLCEKAFAKPEALREHVRTHTGEKPHICSYCDRSFAKRYTLKQHLRLHTNEKPYVCQICHEGFRQNVTLKLHVKKTHLDLSEDV